MHDMPCKSMPNQAAAATVCQRKRWLMINMRFMVPLRDLSNRLIIHLHFARMIQRLPPGVFPSLMFGPFQWNRCPRRETPVGRRSIEGRQNGHYFASFDRHGRDEYNKHFPACLLSRRVCFSDMYLYFSGASWRHRNTSSFHYSPVATVV